MKLWGRTTSVNVQKVMWALEELSLTCERVDVGGPHGGLREPSFLALNPHGLIPTLQDGDVVVWESGAIVRYLGARYGGGRLYDPDPGRRAAADAWMEWSTTTVQPLMTTCFFHAARLRPERRNEATLQAAADGLAAQFAVLERVLLSDGRPYVAGPDLSIADIMIGAQLWRYYELPLPRPVLPALADYYARLSARPAYAATVRVSFDSLIGTL